MQISLFKNLRHITAWESKNVNVYKVEAVRTCIQYLAGHTIFSRLDLCCGRKYPELSSSQKIGLVSVEISIHHHLHLQCQGWGADCVDCEGVC